MELTLPLALGEQIYARAALDGVKREYDSIKVSLNWEQLHLRAPEYRGLVEPFAGMLFSDHPYSFHPGEYFPYRTFEVLHDAGIRARIPWFPEVLCAGGVTIPERPYLTINTKVRFLGRPTFEGLRKPIFRELSRLREKYDIILLGERKLCRTGEYELWGPEAIYSAYDDIVAEVDVEDRTFQAFGTANFNLDRIRRDCALMRHAHMNVLFGIGGPVALALAVGRVSALHHCDCFPYINDLFAEARGGRALVTTDVQAFLGRLRSL